MTWPLFREFRASTEYASAYKEVFGEEYSVVDVDRTQIAQDDETIPAAGRILERSEGVA
jgi:hypothetical protein